MTEIFDRPPDKSDEGDFSSTYGDGYSYGFLWVNRSRRRALKVEFDVFQDRTCFTQILLVIDADADDLAYDNGTIVGCFVDASKTREQAWHWLNGGELPAAPKIRCDLDPKQVRKLMVKSKMSELAFDLGLKPEDLADAVESVYADRAAKINDDGIDAQIEFLFSDYCNGNSETMRALLSQLVREKQAD